MFEKEKKNQTKFVRRQYSLIQKTKGLNFFFCFLSISRYFGSIGENVPYSRGSTRVCDDR